MRTNSLRLLDTAKSSSDGGSQQHGPKAVKALVVIVFYYQKRAITKSGMSQNQLVPGKTIPSNTVTADVRFPLIIWLH